jgi:serine/threonine protein kinase
LKVAIKCISKKKAHGSIDQIRSDVNKLTQIDHPNIIKYHELYEDNRTIFIVMEYEKGEYLFDVLTKRLENNFPFSEYEAAIIMK